MLFLVTALHKVHVSSIFLHQDIPGEKMGPIRNVQPIPMPPPPQESSVPGLQQVSHNVGQGDHQKKV